MPSWSHPTPGHTAVAVYVERWEPACRVVNLCCDRRAREKRGDDRDKKCVCLHVRIFLLLNYTRIRKGPVGRYDSAMTADNRASNVLIAGGGIGGLCAALCLARHGIATTVFEQSCDFEEVGAGIQVSPNASRVLHSLGLEEALREFAFLPQATEFRGWRNGSVLGSAPLGDAAIERYGAPYYHLHRGDLLRVLLDAARNTSVIALETGSQVIDAGTQADRAWLCFDDVRAEADAVVGADGIHSAVRTALWDDGKPVFTGNVAWRALVPTERLPVEHVRPVTTAWWGPGKHFVHYYVRRGTVVNCVCVVEKAGWEVESWAEHGDVAELRRDFRGWSRDLQILLDAVDSDVLYKWALFDRPPMTQWGRGRVTLLGDACHPTLPFMAQGAAMAIEDAAVLASCLTKLPMPAALARYEALRIRRTARVQQGSRRNAKVFHLSGAAAWVRNRALRLVGDRPMADLYRYDVFREILD